MSKVVCKASCRDCNDCYGGKTKRRLHDRKTEHYKAVSNGYSTSALADHVRSTGHNQAPVTTQLQKKKKRKKRIILTY